MAAPGVSASVVHGEAVSHLAPAPGTNARGTNAVTVDAIGVRIGIDLTLLDPPERLAVRSAWRSAVSAPPAQPDRVIAPQRFAETGETLAHLSGAVTRAAVTAAPSDRWMLHAAGLARTDGGVVVLVGRSGAGKTTATRFLARKWGYVSDETVGIDADGTVHPYRKPLSVITDGYGFKVQRAPEDLGLQPVPAAPLHLSRLVLLDRQPGPSAARLIPLADVDALADLTGHSSALTSMTRPLQTIVRLLARTRGAVRAQYTEARDLVALLDQHHAPRAPSPPRADASEAHVPVALPEASTPARGDDEDGPPVYSATQLFRRAPATDWCRLEDGLLAVLTAETSGEGTLRVLAGVAPQLWLSADDTPLDDLIDAVARRHRVPDPASATRSALAALIEAGLVTFTA